MLRAGVPAACVHRKGPGLLQYAAARATCPPSTGSSTPKAVSYMSQLIQAGVHICVRTWGATVYLGKAIHSETAIVFEGGVDGGRRCRTVNLRRRAATPSPMSPYAIQSDMLYEECGAAEYWLLSARCVQLGTARSVTNTQCRTRSAHVVVHSHTCTVMFACC